MSRVNGFHVPAPSIRPGPWSLNAPPSAVLTAWLVLLMGHTGQCLLPGHAQDARQKETHKPPADKRSITTYFADIILAHFPHSHDSSTQKNLNKAFATRGGYSIIYFSNDTPVPPTSQWSFCKITTTGHSFEIRKFLNNCMCTSSCATEKT